MKIIKNSMAILACLLLFAPSYALTENISVWQQGFDKQILAHPQIQAAKVQLQVDIATSQFSVEPLYNPELSAEIEQEGTANNFQIGFSQTIDWWDKQQINQQQSGFSILIAKQNFVLGLTNKKQSILKMLVNYQIAQKQSELALTQEAQLNQFIKIINGRFQAGDVGQIDAQLSLLSLSQTLNETAQSQANLKQIEKQLQEALPNWSNKQKHIPLNYWQSKNLEYDDLQIQQWLQQYPLLVQAKAKWQQTKLNAQLSKANSKAEPSFGITAGQVDKDSTIALNLTIPLNLRTDFSKQLLAANKVISVAKMQYLALKRKQLFAIKASFDVMQAYQVRFKRWQKLTKGTEQSIKKLLNTLWQSNEISTTEYLAILQNKTESLKAGLALQQQTYQARIDWLFNTGQLNSANGLATQGSKK